MQNTKFTPGPWVVSRTSGLEIFINHEHDRADRVPGYFAEVRRFTSDNEQVEANARLIAAAPELLEALQLLDDAYCSVGPAMTRQDRANGRDALMKARAAIAKATGEQP